jgi:methionine-rich copper-binding protein CopC
MKYRLTVAAALFTLSTLAFAHTHLKTSMPADNAVLTAPPSQIMLHFSEPTRLTAVTIQKEGESQQRTLGPLPKEPSADLGVPVASLTPGKYTVNWRAVGDDNHVMSGALHFTVGK